MAGKSKPPRRRAKGSGTEWYERKTKQWRWRVRHKGQDYFVSDADRTRAKEKFADLVASLAKQLDRERGKQSLTTFLEYWLEAVVRRNVRASTHYDYTKRCEIYIVPVLGDEPLNQLTPQLLRRWANATRDGYAYSSAKQALELLTRALDVAVEEKLIDFNPARAVKLPRKQQDETRIDAQEEGRRTFTSEQVERLLAAVKATDRHWTRSSSARSIGMVVLYELAFRLGLRRGELLGLRWKDVDVDNKVLHVRQQVNAQIAVTLPKTDSARRVLPLTDDDVRLLAEHKLKLGDLGHTYVFPDETGNHRKPRALNKHFERTLKRAGLSGFTLHDVRHTCITRWREQGMDLEVAAALAGHKQIDITANVYSEATLERKRAALERMKATG